MFGEGLLGCGGLALGQVGDVSWAVVVVPAGLLGGGGLGVGAGTVGVAGAAGLGGGGVGQAGQAEGSCADDSGGDDREGHAAGGLGHWFHPSVWVCLLFLARV